MFYRADLAPSPIPVWEGDPAPRRQLPGGGGIAGACSPFLGRLRPSPPHPSISASPTTAPDRPLVSVLAAALAHLTFDAAPCVVSQRLRLRPAALKWVADDATEARGPAWPETRSQDPLAG